MFCIVSVMEAMCCWVSTHSLSSSFLSWFWCWWLLGLSVSSRRSPRLRQWLHSRGCGGHVWKHEQQFRSCHQTSSVSVCVPKCSKETLTVILNIAMNLYNIIEKESVEEKLQLYLEDCQRVLKIMLPLSLGIFPPLLLSRVVACY